MRALAARAFATCALAFFTTPPDGARRFAEGNDHFRHVSTFATASIGGLLSYAQIGRVYVFVCLLIFALDTAQLQVQQVVMRLSAGKDLVSLKRAKA